MTFNIEWRANEGYGDFITGLGYAHAATIKYQRPVHIRFHWPNARNHLLSDIDQESIYCRFNHILKYMRPVEDLTISHKFKSRPSYRFINELEEFNPIHGLWYPKMETPVQHGLVAFWTSKHNLEFPGYHKDPLYDHWDQIRENLEKEGYEVVEITYRTPIKDVMRVITSCEFGIGYEGMIHQLFKFTWRPFVVASRRVQLTHLLAAQGAIVTKPEDLLHSHMSMYVARSKRNIRKLLKRHHAWLHKYEDPTLHNLYNKEI